MNAQVKNASSKEEYQPEDFLHLNYLFKWDCWNTRSNFYIFHDHWIQSDVLFLFRLPYLIELHRFCAKTMQVVLVRINYLLTMTNRIQA